MFTCESFDRFRANGLNRRFLRIPLLTAIVYCIIRGQFLQNWLVPVTIFV